MSRSRRFSLSFITGFSHLSLGILLESNYCESFTYQLNPRYLRLSFDIQYPIFFTRSEINDSCRNIFELQPSSNEFCTCICLRKLIRAQQIATKHEAQSCFAVFSPRKSSPSISLNTIAIAYIQRSFTQKSFRVNVLQDPLL